MSCMFYLLVLKISVFKWIPRVICCLSFSRENVGRMPVLAHHKAAWDIFVLTRTQEAENNLKSIFHCWNLKTIRQTDSRCGKSKLFSNKQGQAKIGKVQSINKYRSSCGCYIIFYGLKYIFWDFSHRGIKVLCVVHFISVCYVYLKYICILLQEWNHTKRDSSACNVLNEGTDRFRSVLVYRSWSCAVLKQLPRRW